MPNPPRTLVFDVNETLTDLGGMARHFAAVGAPPALAPTWFAAVLRDGFALTVAGAPTPFADVAASALRTLLGRLPTLGVPLAEAVDTVMAGFATLRAHPDVAPGVERLAEAGVRMVTLSNGATSVADAVLAGAGVRGAFAELLSVADAPAWKPDRRAYEYAAARCGLAPAELMLVAVHPWDIDGASRAGLRTVWLDRDAAEYPQVFAAPELTVAGLGELAAALQ